MTNNSEELFHKKFGTIKIKHYQKAREALNNGKDISLVSESRASQSTTIRGSEIVAWGLNLDALLIDTEANKYAKEIL